MLSMEQINNLPLRTIRVGGILRKIRYDEDSKTIFMLDDNGNFTGRTRKFELPPIEESPEVFPQIPGADQEGSEETPHIDTEAALAEAEMEEESDKTSDRKPADSSKKKSFNDWIYACWSITYPILFAICLFIVITLIFSWAEDRAKQVWTETPPASTAEGGGFCPCWRYQKPP